ncbi:MAG: SDR family oxidoreductase [Thermonemataceae bacterium]|nr:SDR family oxidoreductase [Thermonemataceae bacterium]
MKPSIVVTGGTKGIGRAIVEIFAQNGFHVLTCSRHQKDIDELKIFLANKYPEVQFSALVADLSLKTEVQKFADFVKKESPYLNILVNNAGVFLPGQIQNEEDGVLEKLIETNLYSAYHLSRALLGHLLSADKKHIFNICSTASITPYINGGSYCISKYALYGMTKVLREELKDKNIGVTAVLPGATLTSSWENTDLPPERFMKPEEVAITIWTIYQIAPQSIVEEILIRPQLGDIT